MFLGVEIIMELGIYDIGECGTGLNIIERFEIYKSAGFTHVGFYLDNDYLDGENYVNMIDTAKSIGLKIDQVHLDYKNANMICEERENEYFRYIESKIAECIKYGIPHVVLHASKGNEPPLISNFGLNKVVFFDKILNGSDTKLCFENVRNNTNLDLILNLKLNNIGVCFDSGHAYCYSNSVLFLTKYQDTIYCTHLHDNSGTDTHEMIGEGKVHFDEIYPLLNKTKRHVDYLECFMPKGVRANKDMFKSFVGDCYTGYVNMTKGDNV